MKGQERELESQQLFLQPTKKKQQKKEVSLWRQCNEANIIDTILYIVHIVKYVKAKCIEKDYFGCDDRSA